MASDAASSFEAFVLHRSADLLRTAVLLTHDRAHAEDLLDRALVTTRRHWGAVSASGAPYAYARRVLVTGATGRERRGAVSGIVDVPDDRYDVDAGWDASDRDALTGALATLPPQTRAVLVLSYWEDLSEASVAGVLGRPVDTVRDEAARGLARLRAELKPTGDVEESVRRNFASRADRVEPPSGDLHRTTVDTYRRARRRGTAAVAVGLAAVLAVGGVGLGSRLLEADTPRSDVPIPPADQDLGIYEVPTRGSLAGDEAFVAGVRSIEWSTPMGWEGAWLEPVEADRRVLFAGEVPGGNRWALVMGRVGFQLLYVWYTGPADASGTTLQPTAPPGRGGPDEPMTLMDESRPAATLVVVGLPGDEVEFSPEGSTWEAVPADDGVAVGVVPSPDSLADAELRISRSGGDVVHRSALSYLQPNRSYLPPGAGPGPSDDPDGRGYGERMRACLLVDGWVVTPAAGGAAILASSDFGDPQRALDFQRDRRQCEVILGYGD